MSQGFYGFPNILGVLRATAFKAIGKIGATAGATLAGATTSGAPTSGGPFDVGDVIVSQSDGSLWVCTVAGTSQSSPGTFVQAGFANPMSSKGDLIAGGTAGAATRLAVGSDTYVMTADSTQSTGLTWSAPAGTGLYTAYLNYQDQKTSGTNGGSFTSGAWRTRTLNTEVADTANHGTLASNQITLDAGTYRVLATAPCWTANQNQLRLQNITDSATLCTGQSAYSATGAQCTATLQGRFTLGAAKVIELQHRCVTTSAGTDGFGIAGSFGTEIYATLELWRE